jgi:hypothetical protein
MIVVCNKQGKMIEKGVVRRRSRIVVHNRHEKNFIKKTNRKEDFTKIGT